jgi:hypothetical protein
MLELLRDMTGKRRQVYSGGDLKLPNRVNCVIEVSSI